MSDPSDRAPARAASEAGAALVMALVFLLLFGATVPALLGLAGTSVRAATVSGEQANLLYAADAGVQVAIDGIRRTPGWGIDGGICPNHTTTVNGVEMLVRCQPLPGSGLLTGGVANPNNAPGWAVMSTSTTEVGIQQLSNQTLRVGGGMASRTGVTVPAANAELRVTRGDVRAVGACSGTIVVEQGVRSCNDPATPVAPTYPAPITTLPARQPVPACAPGTVTFQPGWYDDAAALTSLTAGACPGRLFRFNPGIYYLDFRNAGSHEWRVEDATSTVVAGTPRTTGVGCNENSLDGVRFVFGGDSRLHISSGSFYACAPAFADQQRIVVQVLRPATGPGTRTTVAAQHASTATGTPVPGQTGAWAPDVARTARIDGAAASAAVSKGSAATLTIGGFGASVVPAGATITKVDLRVVHQATGDIAGISGTLQAPGLSPARAFTLPVQATLGETRIDVTDVFTANPSRLSNVTVTYSGNAPTGNRSGTLVVDGWALDVTYTEPDLAGASGCLVRTPFDPLLADTSNNTVTSCPLVRTQGNNTTVEFRGTIYAPDTPLSLSMTNRSFQLVDRGIVGRVVALGKTPSSDPSIEAISVPSIAPAALMDRVVTLTACPRTPGQSTCQQVGGSDDVRLVAEVAFPPAGPDIRSWRAVR